MSDKPGVALAASFLDCLEKILERKAEILEDDRLWFVTSREVNCGLMHVGGGSLHLGRLLEAWEQGYLKLPCPGCQADSLVWHAVGSPFSGFGKWRGWCFRCGEVSAKSRVTSAVLPLLAVEGRATGNPLRSRCGNFAPYAGYKPVIRRADNYRFSWTSDAVEPEQKQDIVLEVLAWEEFVTWLADTGSTP